MGEWSKKVGEAGEEIVGAFLELIGWGDSQTGIELPCAMPGDHGTDGKQRRTHGIDFLFSYETPLSDGVIDNVVISSKFTSEAYPSSPSALFKSHIADLSNTIACFKRSQLRQELNSSYSGVESAHDIGVLFWLSNNRTGYDDIIERVSNVRFSEDLVFEHIFVVDNKKASFVYDSINYVKTRFAGDDIQYFYPSTGNNPNIITLETCGTILPVEYINTSVLPVRIQGTADTITLALLVADGFEKDHLKRIMGLGQKLSSNLASKILIAFPDYDKLLHGNDVQIVKTQFKDKKYTERVEIDSFAENFRG